MCKNAVSFRPPARPCGSSGETTNATVRTPPSKKLRFRPRSGWFEDMSESPPLSLTNTRTELFHMCCCFSASTSRPVTLSAVLDMPAMICFVRHQLGWLFSYIATAAGGASMGAWVKVSAAYRNSGRGSAAWRCTMSTRSAAWRNASNPLLFRVSGPLADELERQLSTAPLAVSSQWSQPPIRWPANSWKPRDEGRYSGTTNPKCHLRREVGGRGRRHWPTAASRNVQCDVDVNAWKKEEEALARDATPQRKSPTRSTHLPTIAVRYPAATSLA